MVEFMHICACLVEHITLSSLGGIFEFGGGESEQGQVVVFEEQERPLHARFFIHVHARACTSISTCTQRTTIFGEHDGLKCTYMHAFLHTYEVPILFGTHPLIEEGNPCTP